MKKGCCISLKELEQAIECGFDFVDLSGQELASLPMQQVSKLAQRLEAQNLPCIGIHASIPSSVKLCGDGYSEQALREYLYCLKERLDALNVQMVGIGSPNSRSLPEGFSREKADEQMLRSLSILSEDLPVQQILLESLNTMETNYINSIVHAHALVETIDDPRVGLVLDLYHFLLCGDDLNVITPDWPVAYMHIADPFERRYPSSQTDASLAKLLQDAAALVSCNEIALEACPVKNGPYLMEGLAYLHANLKS